MQNSNKAAPELWLKKALIIVFLFLLFVWANNTSLFSPIPKGGPKLLAHRGLAQTFEIEGLKWDSNTAEMIHTPEHPYLENTIPSMEAAFSHNADMIEFDIRLTKDEKLAVFHDYLLEYRTEGIGLVSETNMEDLEKLDVGYGYTADGGKTFPFRGKGVGLLVSAEKILKTFPDKNFLIHVKDGGEKSGKLLVNLIKSLYSKCPDGFGFYGEDKAMSVIKAEFPNARTLSMATLKKALLAYELIGWTGYIPESIRNTQIHIPLKYAKFLWGWPNKFLNRMDSVNSRIILVNGSGKWSEGFDTETEINLIPRSFNGYIWTNRIDKVARKKSSR